MSDNPVPVTDASHPARVRSRRSIGATRSPESTAAILAATTAILAEEGYRALTLDAVAARAGASKPTIYRWWGSKAALILEVYERAGEAEVAVPDTGTLEQDLLSYLEALWRWWSRTRSGEVLRGLITESQLSPDAQQALRTDFLARRERALKTMLQRAQTRGQLPADAALEAALGMLSGLSWLHLLTGRLDQVDAIGPAVHVLMHGLNGSR